MTPAMAAGVTDKLWDMADLVAMVAASGRPARSPGYLQAPHEARGVKGGTEHNMM
jgi:hypothetical protein